MTEQMDMKRTPQERRRRINRLKKIIIGFLIACILIPLTLAVVLGIRGRYYHTKADNQSRELAWYERALLDEKDQNQRMKALLGIESEQLSSDSDLKDYEQNAIQETSGNSPSLGTSSQEYKEGYHYVYLTFDDGPSIYTDQILDLLKEYDVKATFFVTGKTDPTSLAAYKRIVEEGHTLGMHSYSHVYRNIYASLDAFRQDLQSLQNLLYDQTGVISKYYRFPGGSSNSVSAGHTRELIDYLDASGITYYDWNISSGDASYDGVPSATIKRKVLDDIPKFSHSVVLLHDSAAKKTTLQALPEILETITAMEKTEVLPITEETPLVQHITKEKL